MGLYRHVGMRAVLAIGRVPHIVRPTSPAARVSEYRVRYHAGNASCTAGLRARTDRLMLTAVILIGLDDEPLRHQAETAAPATARTAHSGE